MKHVANKIVILFAMVVLLEPGTACNKLLSVPDNAGGQLVTAKVFSDSVNATAGVLGMYTSAGLTNKNVDIFTGLTGDELLYSGTTPSFLASYEDSLYAGSSSATAPMAAIWANFYAKNAIYQANAALEGLAADPDSTISTATKNQLIGECEVLRAFCYFYLANLYGGVPLVTHTSFQTNATLPRASVDSVYHQITSDLLDAQTKLQPAYPSAGRQRPNRYTASALLARVYLYTKQWAAAQAMADTVLNCGLYSLVPNLANVFLDKSTEAIWQLGSNSPSAPKSAPGGTPFYASSIIAPAYLLAPPLLQAFDSGDARQTTWTASKTGYLYVNGAFASGSFYYATKYRNTGATSIYNNTTEDLMMLRLAEMYLIRAEARAQQGDLAGAMQDVNTIRSRAGLTTPVTAATLPDALGLILHERQVEFFCEWGHRWMDLNRMDSIGPVMSRTKPSFWPADGHAALYPISFGEFQANPLLTQNPGY